MNKIAILLNTGRQAFLSNDYRKALQNYSAVFGIDPENIEALNGLGNSLIALEQFGAGEKFLKTAASYESVASLVSLCDFYRRTGKIVELQATLQFWQKIKKGELEYRLYSGVLWYFKKNYRKSISLLSSNYKSLGRKAEALAFSLCAQSNEKIGNYELAFELYNRMNQVHKVTLKESLAYPNYVDSLDIFSEVLESDKVSRTITPIFLTGMPRSGTTLLETMISSHPVIDNIQEKGVVESVFSGYKKEKIALQELRNQYFGLVEQFKLKDGTKFLLDKYPLNIIHLDFIQKLFPESTIIVSVRHPYDVVLSCFKQNFGRNTAMDACTSLERSIILYDAVLSRYKKIKQHFGCTFLEIKYEDLVASQEKELVKIMSRLKLRLSEEVFNYRETIKDRVINTPSASQVSQPIYKTSDGLWKYYESQLRSAGIDRLRGWVDYFGYIS